ncbi:hypothetical protein [Deinococcus rubellus]
MIDLTAGEARRCRVGAARSSVGHPDGYEMGESNDRLLVCWCLAAAG